jgi:hypothetical protein
MWPTKQGNIIIVLSLSYTPLGIKISSGKTPREIGWQKFGGGTLAEEVDWDRGPAVGGDFPMSTFRDLTAGRRQVGVAEKCF